jgi:hypothetical protein
MLAMFDAQKLQIDSGGLLVVLSAVPSDRSAVSYNFQPWSQIGSLLAQHWLPKDSQRRGPRHTYRPVSLASSSSGAVKLKSRSIRTTS